MPTTDLLIHRYNGEELVPTRLPLDKKKLALAAEIIGIFGLYRGKKRLELDEELAVLEGAETDYRVKRGLSHLLLSGFCAFETVSSSRSRSEKRCSRCPLPGYRVHRPRRWL